VTEVRRLPQGTRLGLLFGNERTGLTSDEILHANAVFTIPQAVRQPSYNLASAVLLTLFALFMDSKPALPTPGERTLPRREQEAAIDLILEKLAAKGFVHGTNRAHVTAMLHDLLGRLAMTEKDRRLLLAMFTKGVDEKRIPDEGE
jgi:tRNA/rRNA methyltransferase